MSPGKSPPGKGKMHLLDMMKVRSSRPFSLMIDLLHFYQGTSMGQNKLILDNLPKVGIKWRGQSVQSVSECSLSRRLSEGGSMSRRRYSTRWDLAPPGLGSECTRHAPDLICIRNAPDMHPTNIRRGFRVGLHGSVIAATCHGSHGCDNAVPTATTWVGAKRVRGGTG